MTDEDIYIIKETDGELFIERWDKEYKPPMKCGHVANATTTMSNSDGTGELTIYCCAICFGINPDASIVGEIPDLTGRKARCSYCGKIVDSSFDLPFFSYQQDKEFDDYYCGCRGWD